MTENNWLYYANSASSLIVLPLIALIWIPQGYRGEVYNDEFLLGEHTSIKLYASWGLEGYPKRSEVTLVILSLITLLSYCCTRHSEYAIEYMYHPSMVWCAIIEAIPLAMSVLVNMVSYSVMEVEYGPYWVEYECQGEKYWFAHNGTYSFSGDREMKWYRSDTIMPKCPVNHSNIFESEYYNHEVTVFHARSIGKLDSERSQTIMTVYLYSTLGLALIAALQMCICCNLIGNKHMRERQVRYGITSVTFHGSAGSAGSAGSKTGDEETPNVPPPPPPPVHRPAHVVELQI